MSHYQKPPELYDGLRLHQNENTGGCSPRVLEALARLRAGRDRVLPAVRGRDATRARSTSASTPDRVALTNGLDEGIMALAVAYLRPPVGGPMPKRSCPSRRSRSSASTPAVVGGQLVQVMPHARLQLSRSTRCSRRSRREHAWCS